MLVKKTFTLGNQFKEFAEIEELIPHGLNKKIFKYLNIFSDDKDLLTASLLINPFDKTKIPEAKNSLINSRVLEFMKQLNKMHDLDRGIINQYGKNKSSILLYLTAYKVLFDKHSKYPQSNGSITKEKIAYAMDLLKRSDISELHLELEDRFFSYLNPKIYNHYRSLLRFTKDSYHKLSWDIKKYFNDLLEEENIKVKIESRLKSIYSIHKKIIEKNLLYSQILDTFGLRFILNSTEDCYKTMGIILKQHPIMVSKIKDYIAIPKENGYQSIHLTIVYQNHPVEIQIRTKKMHHLAQYGCASHLNYKNGNSI